MMFEIPVNRTFQGCYMAQVDRQQSVMNILQDLRNLDGLKKLFCEELNYERENKPLSPRQWPDSAKQALAEDPILLVSGGCGGVGEGDRRTGVSALRADEGGDQDCGGRKVNATLSAMLFELKSLDEVRMIEDVEANVNPARPKEAEE